MVKHLSKLLLLVALCVPWATQAQGLSTYGFVTGVDASKWVDMTSATEILTPVTSGSDSKASTVQDIGFEFSFGGNTYTQYSVNTDGNLRLGSTVTGTSNYTTPFSSSYSNSNNPKINAFGCDGYGVYGSHYVKALLQGGTRLVVEFCMGTYNTTTRNYLYKWQIHLYSNGNIDIVFPSASDMPSTAPAVAHQCGICVNNSDGWVVSSNFNTAMHFSSGGSTVTNAAGTWFDANRYYSFIHPDNITCPIPTNLQLSDITANSVTLSWEAGGSESAWKVTVGNNSYFVTNNSYTVTGLESNTPYAAVVRAICGVGDTSPFAMDAFRTSCASISSMPYSNGFESDPYYVSGTTPYADAFPYCWTRINDATGTTNYYPHLSNTANYVHSGSVGMYWSHTTTSTYANNEYAVLPPVDLSVYDISDLTLTFYAKTTSASYHPQPIVGVMTDPTDASTFTEVHTFNAADITTTWQQFVIPLSSYSGSGSYIAIKWPRPTSTCYMAIDDIYLTDEWCDVPEDVAVSSTATTMTVSWDPYSGTNFTVFVGDDTVHNVTGSSYTFTGLTPNTLYHYGVARECSSSLSFFIEGNYRTDCNAISSFPYNYGFEDAATGTSAVFPDCWTRINDATGTSNYYPYVSNSASYAHSGSKGLYWYHTTTTTNADNEYAVLPGVDLSVHDIADLTLMFYAKTTSASYHPQPIIGVMTDRSDASTFTPVYTFSATEITTDWQQFVIPLSSYTGSGNYVAIKWPRTASTCYMAIDDIFLGVITCFPPSDVTIANTTPTTATLSWTPNGNETEWNLRYAVAGSDVFTTVNNISSSSYTLTSLVPNTTYTYAIQANCGSEGMSLWGNNANFTTARCAVSDLTVVAVTASAVQVEWTPSQYTTTSQVEYKLSDASSWTVVGTTNGTSQIITGLTAGTSYDLRVKSTCEGADSYETISFVTGSLGCIEYGAPMDVAIGTGTSASTYLPVSTCYNYSLSQQIYTAAELNTSGALNAISFMPKSVATPNGLSRDIEIYIGHYASATATNFVYPADLTLVYSGSPSFVADQWCNITFDTPFEYNGTDNLLVMVRDLTGVYSCSNNWYVHTASSGSSRYAQQDSGPYYIGSTTGGTSQSNRMNAIFTFLSCSVAATCANPSIVVDTVDAHTAQLSWLPGANETSWKVYYKESEAANYQYAATVTERTYTVSGLESETDYDFRVVAMCSATDSADATASATTAPSSCARVSNLTVASVSTGAAMLTWEDVAFGTYASARIEYKESSASAWTVAGTATGFSYLLTGLTDDTEYDVRVKTFCANGDSSRYETVSLTTKALGCLVYGAPMDVAIGTGTSTYNYFPTYNLYNYSLTQQIFTAAELNVSGPLNGIAFMPASVNADSRDIEVYIGHYASETATNFVYPADLTLVYSGSPSLVADQWCNITFDTPFEYNGTENLLVMFRDMTGTWVSANSYYAHTATSGSSRYIYQDDAPYYIGSTTGGTSSNYRMNTIFKFQSCDVAASCGSPGVTLDTIGTHTAELSWIPGGNETSWKVYYKTADESNFTYAGTTTSMEYTVTGLAGETDYEFRVYAMCSATDSGYASVFGTTLPSCVEVSGLTATNITTTGATITWTAGSQSVSYLNNNEVNYTLKYVTLGGTDTMTRTVNGTSYLIPNGAPATTYYVTVQSNCGTVDGLSPVVDMIFSTDPLTATLPYSCNFNSSASSYSYYWVFQQAGQTNHWMIGNAAHDGNNGALYITSDDVEYDYDNSEESYSYAYVQLNLADSGEYEYSFDWNCYGEGNWDFMRVALVPTSTTLTYSESGTSFGSGSYSASAVPTGAITLDGGKLNLSSDWGSLDGVVNLTGAQRGMYRLVFYWRNDNSAGSNPPAAIDNIVFKRLTCHKPTALAAVLGSDNVSAELSWTNNETGTSTWEVEYGTAGFLHGEGTVVTVNSNPATVTGLQPNQTYDFYVRNVCGTDDLSAWSTAAHVTTACGVITALPYTATFENDVVNNFANCWTYNGNHPYTMGSTVGAVIVSGSSNVHGGNRALSIKQHDTITENQYAAMNAVAANLPMAANQVTFYARGTEPTAVTVGVMSNPEDASTFSAIKTVNITSSYAAYSVMLDAYNGNGQHLAFMVAPASNNRVYIDDVTLDFMPECPTPDDMLAVSTDDGIRLNWNGHKSSVDQWQIRYTWKHIDSTEAYRQVDTLLVNASDRRADGSYIFENPELVTNYTFAVRNVCDAANNEYSEWSNVADLTTDICSNMFIDTIGSNDSAAFTLPVVAYQRYSYSQQIILASEVETKASISALRLLFNNSENYRVKNNVSIYLGLTEKTTFSSNSDFVPMSSLTQVYSGALNMNAESWNQIIFTTPFEYTDTTKNIVVAFLDNSNRTGLTDNTFAVANTGANRSIYAGSTSPINPSGSLTGSRTALRNVMQLVNCVNCSAPSTPVSLSTYTSATAQWTDNATALSHQVYIVPANEVNAQTIENIDWENDAFNAPSSNYTFANLDSATTYMWVARNVCAAGINSEALTSYVSTKKFVDLSVCDNESTGYAFAPTTNGTYAGNVQTEYQSEGVYNNMYTTVHVSVRATSSTTDLQTACDEYTWSANGMSYIVSNNTDMATLTNAAGCDSVVTLNLTVNYSNTGVDTRTVCDNMTWIDGNVYTESTNTPTFTLTNAANCDSVVTLNLTVNHSDTSIFNATACDSYTWPLNGQTYTASNNTDFVTLSNQYGCDSIVKLNLAVGYSGSYIATVTACDSYTWNGNTYTASTNAPVLTLPNQYGCDSTVNLHLTVNYSTAAVDLHTACDSYSWIDGNVYTASNNTATYTLTNAVNCDSVVTLNLLVKYSSFVTDDQVACDNYTWMNGITYTASTNAPKVTYPSANGCDSVITLNLVVNYSTAATDVINACDSYTWIDGNEYTASNNTATYTLTNAVNCDSLVTLDLTVGYTSYYTDVITACLTYTWIDGNTYTASTNTPVFAYIGGNAEGCDSVVTLNLTVNPKYTVTYHANHLNVSGGMPTPSICAHETYTIIPNRYMSFGFRLIGWSLNATDTVPMFVEGDVLTMDSNIVLYGVWEEGCPDAIGVRNIATCVTYDWRGYTFTESGVYYDTVPGALYNICDSVYQLNLTIYDASATTFLANACDSYTWPLNGQTYYALPDEPATVVYANAHGCDSVVTLNLTLRHSTAREDVVSACDTYTWPLNNVTYTTSTVAQNTITNAVGCDSVQTLRLTLGHSNTGVETVAACVSYNWYGTTYTASTNNPTHTLTNASGCDSVVSLHLTINQPSSSIVNVSSCESYTWHGTTYTASTNNPTYVMTGADVNGCDSTVHLHLTINHATTGIYTVATCDSYNWYGTTYTASTNAPTRTIAHGNSNGCDSIVNLHLTIYPSKTTVASATACETYTWNNNVYGVSGSYTQHFSTVHGCDSAVTLNLTINHAVNSYVTVQSCSSYSWHGTNYTNSGRYSYTTTAANGCDSVVTLVLTINQPTSGVETVTACGPYTWYGTTYTTSTNSATHILTGANVNGCDSTVTLHLTINAPTTGTETVVACDSYTWRDGVTYTASTNTPTYHYTNANGCDSVVTLNLTINHGTTTTDVIEACDSYTWINGKTYYASTNSPVYYSVGDNGCTNTTILDLTINYSVKVYTAESAVNSYEWHGQTYTESGEYTWVGKTAEGCDSTVVMTLYITVGIDEASALDAITVYPNPTAGQLTFSTDEVSKVEVMDLYGRKVAVFENKNVIDLSNLPAGAYTLRVTLPEGTIVRRVVKR